MIPYQILFAAIATLICLTCKMVESLGYQPNNKSFKWIDILFTTMLCVAVFFWMEAILLVHNTLTIVISAVTAILAVVCHTLINFAEKHRLTEGNTGEFITPVGKIGIINKKISEETYVGTLVDGDAIIVHSTEEMNEGDNFIVARFDEGEFIAEKYNKENNLA